MVLPCRSFAASNALMFAASSGNSNLLLSSSSSSDSSSTSSSPSTSAPSGSSAWVSGVDTLDSTRSRLIRLIYTAHVRMRCSGQVVTRENILP